MRIVYGVVGLLLVLAVVGYPVLVISFPGGAPDGFNGGPASSGDCTLCHSSFGVNSGKGSVEIVAPPMFTSGDTLSFDVVVDNTTTPFPSGAGLRQGFSVSVHDAEGAFVGQLLPDGVNTQTNIDSTYATHTGAGNGLSTWTLRWAIPDDAPESVTFYVAANAGNGGEGPLGDYIYTDSFTLQRGTLAREDEAPPAAQLGAAFPNPFVETATLTYTLERPMDVTVTLYDGVGRVVRVLEEGRRGAGPHTVAVAAGDLAAGNYFVQMRSEGGTEARALTLAR